MPLAAKLTDKGTRHDGYYETVITAGSSTVFIDGLPAARQGEGDHSGQSEGRCVVYPHLIHLMSVRWIQCTTFVDIILLKNVTNSSQMVTARERPPNRIGSGGVLSPLG